MAEDAKTSYSLRNDRPTEDVDSNIVCENVIVEAFCADYENFKSRNCRQKSKFNLSHLRDWSQQKNLQTDNDSLLLITEALRRSENNLRPLISVIEGEIGESDENEWSSRCDEVLMKEVNHFFGF